VSEHQRRSLIPVGLNRAISIRQPWAWAVVHAGKDVENRSETAIRAYRPAVGQRILVHASKGMTRVEYERAVEFMTSIGVQCPALDDLAFGGVIGIVLVVDVVERHRSRWFHGPFALALADPRSEPFLRCADRPACSGSSRHAHSFVGQRDHACPRGPAPVNADRRLRCFACR
jgi:hypothetical protein